MDIVILSNWPIWSVSVPARGHTITFSHWFYYIWYCTSSVCEGWKMWFLPEKSFHYHDIFPLGLNKCMNITAELRFLIGIPLSIPFIPEKDLSIGQYAPQTDLYMVCIKCWNCIIHIVLLKLMCHQWQQTYSTKHITLYKHQNNSKTHCSAILSFTVYTVFLTYMRFFWKKWIP